MKKQLLLAAIFFISLFFAGCKKNFSDEQYVAIENPAVPDFTAKVKAAVSGYVMDENNDPVYGAVITAGSKNGSTDQYGYFRIADADLTKNAGMIKIEKAGYYKNYKTFIAKDNKESFLRIKLLTKTETGIVNATTGGTVTSADGSSVTFSAGSVVTASNNNNYGGQIHVFIRSVNPAAGDAMTKMPGDGRGTDSEGKFRTLQSNAAIAVELYGDAGEKLQIASGKTAAVSLPINPSIAGSAAATITLWSLDETTGLWKQESSATKSGNKYAATVTHFSFWDAAAGLPVVNFTAQVVNSSLQPLANVPVMITPAGVPWNAGYGTFGFTDVNGIVSGAVPANASLTLDVVTTCFTSAYSHNFSTTNSDMDLGTLTGNLGQSMVTLSGTVKNCSGQPVTNGYVQTYDHGFYNRINIVNGAFSFTGLFCSNLPVNYVAVDLDTHQQNTPASVNLVPGSNSLGTLTACGTSLYGFINYSVNAAAFSFTEPADTLNAYFDPASGYTTILKLVAGQPSPATTFQFGGGAALGSSHTIYDIWSPQFASGRAYAPSGLTVTITEFGSSGGFISGSFSGVAQDFNTPSVTYNLNYNFRVKRFN